MNIKIDGKEIQVHDPSKNIVEIAEENGIIITAPCFRNKKKHGCCKVCVVEADGQKAYACGLKAKDGMAITYNREDLAALRKERLNSYARNIKAGENSLNTCNLDPSSPSSTSSECDCSCNTGNNSSCCS